MTREQAFVYSYALRLISVSAIHLSELRIAEPAK